MIFLINKSPFETKDLESCLKIAGDDTPILLYENGVYGAAAGSKFESEFKEAFKGKEIYVLDPDLDARAIENIIDGIEKVDYAGFVDLVEKHSVCPWI